MDKLEWPSERVAHGGIFHQRNVNYSKETHEMIKSEHKLFFVSNFLNNFPSALRTHGRVTSDNDATQQDQLLPP